MSATSDMIRKMFGEGDAARDAGLTTPWDVVRFDDIRYGGDDAWPEWQLLDLYRPVSAGEKKLPVIIIFHGGGWVYGDKSVYQFYGMSLAQRGFAVVNFSYRLAPEVQFPAPLEDMNQVAWWIMEHAEEFGLDTDHIFAVGDSAGGHGLGLFSAYLTNPEFAANFDFTPPEGFGLSAVALNCGAYTMGDGDKALQADYFPEGLDEALLTVPNWVTDAYPPTYLMTANQDFLKVQAPMMQEALTACEVPFVLAVYGTKEKPLGHVFHCNMREPMATVCNDDEVNFFRRYI